MDLLEIYESKNIGRSKYDSIVFYGSSFLSLNKKENCIDIFDYNFKKTNSLYLNETLSSICYDEKDNCFYAITTDEDIQLLKIDSHFKTISSHTLHINIKPENISYNFKKDCITLHFYSNIIEIDKNDLSLISNIDLGNNFDFCININNNFLCSSKKEGFNYISLVNNKGRVLSSEIFKGNNEIINISIKNNNTLFILCKKNNNYFILKAKLNLKNYDKYNYSQFETSYNFDNNVNSFNTNYIDEYNNFYKTDFEYNDYSNNSCNNHCNNCNQALNLSCVDETISEILKEEGKKLKTLIQKANSINEIICINDSIIKILDKITELQKSLIQH